MYKTHPVLESAVPTEDLSELIFKLKFYNYRVQVNVVVVHERYTA